MELAPRGEGSPRQLSETKNTKESIAGPVVLMFLSAMAIVWWVYSALFPQDVLTFLLMLMYIPIVGIAAVFLYRRIKMRENVG